MRASASRFAPAIRRSASTNDAGVTSQIGPWGLVPIWVLSVTDEKGQPLAGADLRVYIALRSYADQGRRAFPFVETIAARAGVTKRSAERSIRKLRELGLVETKRKYRDDGTITACDYVLQDVKPALTSKTVHMDGTDEMDGGAPTIWTEQEQTMGTDQRTELNCLDDPRFAPVVAGANDEPQKDLGKKPATFEDWKPEDLDLFASLVGDRLTSDGSVWKQGTYPAVGFYKAFRVSRGTKANGKAMDPMEWPGRWFRALDERGQVEEWLATQGLETA